MDMELQRVTLEGYCLVCDMMFAQEETLESIVPDAYPDISRIVSATGTVSLKDKDLGEGTLRMTGTAKVTVLYIPESRGPEGPEGQTPENEAAPRALEIAIPFQCAKDDPRFHSGGSVQAEIHASSADARAINPRKILVRVNLAVWAAAYEQESRELSCDIAGAEHNGLEKRLIPCKCYTIPEITEKVFTFSDVLRPPASKPEMEELMFFRTELGTLDAKFIGKKLVLKGDIQLSVLYRCGDGLSQARFELPYSQILDLGDTTEEAEPDVTVILKRVDCHLMDGELEIEVEALAQASLWARRSLTLINDAYCISQPIEVERTPLRLCSMAERSSRRESARMMCASDIPAKLVLDCNAALISMASAPVDGGLEFSAQFHASVLYFSEDDALCAVDAVIPVSCRAALPEGAVCACRCRPIGEATAVPVTGGLEVRFEAEFFWNTVLDEQINCVTDIQPSAVPVTKVRPSVVIRRVGEGESLWDIAKSCGAAVGDICSANGLQSEEAASGTLLLIPTRRS